MKKIKKKKTINKKGFGVEFFIAGSCIFLHVRAQICTWTKNCIHSLGSLFKSKFCVHFEYTFSFMISVFIFELYRPQKRRKSTSATWIVHFFGCFVLNFWVRESTYSSIEALWKNRQIMFPIFRAQTQPFSRYKRFFKPIQGLCDFRFFICKISEIYQDHLEYR